MLLGLVLQDAQLHLMFSIRMSQQGTVSEIAQLPTILICLTNNAF